MFHKRNVYGENAIDTTNQELLSNFNDLTLETSTKYFVLKIIPDKIKKCSIFEEFLARDFNRPKILLITSGYPKILNLLSMSDLEVFTIQEIIINPMQHKYSPRSVHVLSKDESKKFLQDMDISFLSLPQIKINDPLARYFKLKLDDIIEIERTSVASGISLYYRRVVE
jgi:DNA-directed RNA polymerase subunit H (RpoH/RPB5)